MINSKPIYWEGDVKSGHVVIIDQTKLPVAKELLKIKTKELMWDAIKKLKIRGAPAIGIAAAFGVVLGTREFITLSKEEFLDKVIEVAGYLETSRPTAVNLFWALNRMKDVARELSKTEENGENILGKLLQEAQNILKEDFAMCEAIGENGEKIIEDGANVLTHCNAGGLATSGYGTALAVIFSAFSNGKKIHVYADETRPLWQGARLTTWELKEAGFP